MKYRKIVVWTSVIVMLLSVSIASFVSSITPETLETSSYTWGSEGKKVKEIQTKLKNWGYYEGTVDGKYGYKTWEAVKKFQEKNGLKEDGVAGKKTLEKLGVQVEQAKATANQGGTGGHSKDVYVLAAAIHGEGRGESYIGQVAIGAVILNRVRHASFPNTIAGVVYQPGAFDAVKDGQINLTPGESSLKAARDAINGWDPTSGAIYYWNPATAKSKWIWSVPITKRIGKHVFGKK